MIAYDSLLSRFEAVRKAGRGHIARCPAHADKSPSLSIREGDDGRILMHCHAGCTFEAVVSAIGLTVADFFPGTGGLPKPAPGVSFSALRRATDHERSIMFIVSADRRKGMPVSDADKARADIAKQRIASAGRFGC